MGPLRHGGAGGAGGGAAESVSGGGGGYAAAAVRRSPTNAVTLSSTASTLTGNGQVTITFDPAADSCATAPTAVL